MVHFQEVNGILIGKEGRVSMRVAQVGAVSAMTVYAEREISKLCKE